jgi:Raf kinase inhibitor-like YbhB/YbcL family protein
MKRLATVASLFLLVACGGGSDGPSDAPPGDDDAPTGDDAATDSPAGVFAITSPLYDEGGAIPSSITCDGANTSPQLDWVAAPAGTLSYAIVFTDLNNMLIHSVIYDIPANLTGLPADVEKVFAPTDVAGAHQTRNFSGNAFGYAGPCPPSTHTYEFKLYAIDVATLPGADMNTTRAQAKLIIEMHDLATTALTGMYTPL